MTSFVQSASVVTKQVLIGPEDNVAIDINGRHYPVNFIHNGGAISVAFHDGMFTLTNFENAIGNAVQMDIPFENGQIKKLNILVHSIGSANLSYRLITWSLY